MTRRAAKTKLIILDRDGVINRDSASYIKSAAEWQPLPGSISAIARLSKAGYTVTIASNQSGLARGFFDRNALRAMHAKLRRLVAADNGRVDRIVVCPHGPDDGCVCRKPKPGLLLRIASYYKTELAGVPFIGDSLKDLQAALTAGAKPVLVRTGNGSTTERQLRGELAQATTVFDDLAAAAQHLTRQKR